VVDILKSTLDIYAKKGEVVSGEELYKKITYEETSETSSVLVDEEEFVIGGVGSGGVKLILLSKAEFIAGKAGKAGREFLLYEKTLEGLKIRVADVLEIRVSMIKKMMKLTGGHMRMIAKAVAVRDLVDGMKVIYILDL